MFKLSKTKYSKHDTVNIINVFNNQITGFIKVKNCIVIHQQVILRGLIKVENKKSVFIYFLLRCIFLLSLTTYI